MKEVSRRLDMAQAGPHDSNQQHKLVFFLDAEVRTTPCLPRTAQLFLDDVFVRRLYLVPSLSWLTSSKYRGDVLSRV